MTKKDWWNVTLRKAGKPKSTPTAVSSSPRPKARPSQQERAAKEHSNFQYGYGKMVHGFTRKMGDIGDGVPNTSHNSVGFTEETRQRMNKKLDQEKIRGYMKRLRP